MNLVSPWTSIHHVSSKGREERRSGCVLSVLNRKIAAAKTRSSGSLPNSPLSSGEYPLTLREDSSDDSRRVFLLSSQDIHSIDDVPLASYHMQYSHGPFRPFRGDARKFTRISGISAFSAAPFSPPMIFRTKPRNQVTKHERSQITEGKCHKCSKWIPLETIKDADVKVRFIYVPTVGNSRCFAQVKEIFWLAYRCLPVPTLPAHLDQPQVETCRYLSPRIHNRRGTRRLC